MIFSLIQGFKESAKQLLSPLTPLTFLTLLTFLTFLTSCHSEPEPGPFDAEVALLEETLIPEGKEKELLLFTGSSSMRMWTNVAAEFPDFRVVNTGFGGSTMNDLLFYADRLVLPYKPDLVFIYEGDNDISNGQFAEDVLATTRELSAYLLKKLPRARLCFISPKPSPSRWHLRDEYRHLNRLLAEHARQNRRIDFLDVWPAMMDENGVVRNDLFLDDQLHMNEKGYEIWAVLVKEYLSR